MSQHRLTLPVRRRKGFTLIELLVVIGIVGALIGLLLPAVQKVREASKRVSCSNNLKNCGLALHNFENNNSRFPPGAVHGPLLPWVVNDSVHGFWPFILPYLEQEPLYRQYRWDQNWNGIENQAVTSVQLKIMQCPSAELDRFGIGNAAEPSYAACTDYAPLQYVSSALAGAGLINPVGDYNGVMVISRMARMSDITDGTSRTLLLVEQAGRPKRWEAGIEVSGTAAGGPWASSLNVLGIWGSSINGAQLVGPCAINCTNNSNVYSFHPGGSNTVFVDGSVHFLNANIDIRVLAALVTKAGGELISLADF